MLSFEDCRHCGTSCKTNEDIMKQCSDDGLTEYDLMDEENEI